MDTPKPPHTPNPLLDDLESIRDLLGEQEQEPPLLIDSLDPDSIPLLSDIVTPTSQEPPAPHAPRGATQQTVVRDNRAELSRLDSELRAAAQLILQDVIDDFVPQIEAELKRRLEARLTRLLPPRR